MAPNFWDTSGLFKLYVPERGSDRARLLADLDPIVISTITIVEFAAALRKRWLTGELTDEQRTLAHQRFLADVDQFVVLGFTDEIRTRSVRLLARESRIAGRLRGFDSIQLGSAIWWFERAAASNIEAGAFIVADRPLREAAVALGLTVENPEDYE